MASSYIPYWVPFHVEPDGFRVWLAGTKTRYDGVESDILICASPTAVTYRGDMKGVVRFIERERARLSR